MFFTVVGEHEVRAQGADVDINLMAYADDVLNLVVEENEDNWQAGINMMMEVFKKHFSAAGLCMNPPKSDLVVCSCGRLKKQLHVGGQMEAKDAKLLVPGSVC